MATKAAPQRAMIWRSPLLRALYPLIGGALIAGLTAVLMKYVGY